MRASAWSLRSRRALVGLCLVAVDCQPEHVAWAACRRIGAAAIDECSGIARSRRQPGIFWVHNDSGDSARFFALDRQGALRCEVRVDGARNVDWEDIALDDAGHVYLGDFGNNRNARRDLCVYVVDEPEAAASLVPLHVPVLRTLRFRYADQTAYPDPQQLNFDCEAMYWSEGALWLLSKHRSDIRTTLYRLDPNATGEQVLEPLGGAEIGSPVTAACRSDDGRYLAVLSYQYLHLFERPAGGASDLNGRTHVMLIEGRQCEGLCFDGDWILFTNEQRDIHCLPLEFVRTHDRYLPQPPSAHVPYVEVRLDGRALEWSGPSGRLQFDRFSKDPQPGRAQSVDSAVVRVGWDPRGLLVHARWRPPATDDPVLFVMLGTEGPDKPCLSPGQVAWEASRSGDTLALAPAQPEPGQPRCAPVLATTAAATVTRRGSAAVDFEALLPVPGDPALEPGAKLLFNIVLRAAGDDAESAWSAVLDMQPLGNPLLWGHAVLEPARGAARR